MRVDEPDPGKYTRRGQALLTRNAPNPLSELKEQIGYLWGLHDDLGAVACLKLHSFISTQ